MNRIKILSLLIWAAVSALPGAVLTQLTSPAQFGSATVETFESSINGPGYTFDPSTFSCLASGWTSGGTPSGVGGLCETDFDAPLAVKFTADQFQVGAWFGNDDFGYIFAVRLEVFDAANVSLGFVTVTSNGNDLADQFIGLRSDTAFRSAAISYQRPQAGGLYPYIDDFMFGGSPVPEPATWGSAGLVLGALMIGRWPKRR